MEFNRKILADAIAKYGEQKQIDVALEELGELISAIIKFRRDRVERCAVQEEIADVMIMCEQLRMIFGDYGTDYYCDYKMHRLAENLHKNS